MCERTGSHGGGPGPREKENQVQGRDGPSPRPICEKGAGRPKPEDEYSKGDADGSEAPQHRRKPEGRGAPLSNGTLCDVAVAQAYEPQRAGAFREGTHKAVHAGGLEDVDMNRARPSPSLADLPGQALS